MASTKTRVLLKTLESSIMKKRVVSTSPISKQSVAAISLHDARIQTQCPLKKAVQTMDSVFNKPQQMIDPIQTPTDQVKTFEQVPGPKGLPIVGTLFDYFKKDGLQFSKMFEAYRQRALEFGPIYKEQIATISTVVISDPEQYSKVMRAEGKYPIRREMEPMAYYRQQKGYDLGLVNAQGEEWHKYRTVTAKKMLKMKEVQDFCSAMNEVGNDFMTHLNERRQANHEIVGLEKEIFKWAMESIGTFLFEERIGCFGHPPPEKTQAFIDNLRGYFQVMQPLMYNLPVYKLVRTKLWKQYEHFADNVMKIGRYFVEKKMKDLSANVSSTETTEDGEEKVAFLTYMLSQQSLTPDEALSTAVDLLTAATETTSNAILWTFYCLAKNPEIQEKLYKETNNTLHGSTDINASNLSKLTYVKAVLKESFRMYPITWATSRITQEDIEVCGYKIPSGTHVQANLYGMFKDENLYPEAEKFKPERWLRGNMDSKLKSLSNLVWGHGARMCIGRRFAEQEMHILLTKIVQNFKLEYHHEDIEPTLNTVMTPDRPVVLKFIPRNGANSS